jgi:hypothetical protein
MLSHQQISHHQWVAEPVENGLTLDDTQLRVHAATAHHKFTTIKSLVRLFDKRQYHK